MRNRFKYVCADCGNEQFETKAAMTHRCRPRCTRCGSTFLEPKTETAVQRIVDGEAAHQTELAKKRNQQNF